MATAHRVKTPFLMKIGRCGKCMRQSSQALLLAWATFGAVALLLSDGIWVTGAAAIAVSCTALWLTHVAVFAVRWLDERKRVPARAGSSPAPALAVTRRRLIGVMLTGIAAGIAVSFPFPRLARAACGDCANQFGAGWLDCITNFCSTEGQYCCPPDYPYLNHCDCLCYDTTEVDCGSYSDCNYCG